MHIGDGTHAEPSGDIGRLPTPDQIRAQVERILANPLFEANARRRHMLRYIVEETLEGRADLLKGYTVALAVFGREESFDAQADPIVRIEARRLRNDLDGYYAGPGHHDPLRIGIPKGGYVPLAHWQEAGPYPERPHPEPAETVDPVSTTVPAVATEIVPQPRPLPVARPTSWFRNSAPITLIALSSIIVATLMFSAAQVWRSRSDTLATQVPPVYAIPLIVLPFAALDASAETELLAQGFTAELIADLVRFSGLKLFAANASFRQDPAADPATLASDLGIAFVVRGSLAVEGDRVRVIATLVDASTSQVLWSESYDRTVAPGEFLAIKDFVSGEIASALGQANGVVNTTLVNRASSAPEPGMESYLCVLQAQAYRRTFDEALHDTARACLEQAVDQDPHYANAWAMLGWLQLDEVRFSFVPAAFAAETMDSAFSAASRAVELEPDNVLALQALASIDYYAGRFEDSEALMRVALALNPNDPETLVQYGWRLSARGKFEEGLPLVEQAIARTIMPPGWYYHALAVHEYLDGDYVAAIESAERSAVNGSGIGLSLVAASQAALGHDAEAADAVIQMGLADPDMLIDPAAVYRTHQVIDPIVDEIVSGLRNAGWTEP